MELLEKFVDAICAIAQELKTMNDLNRTLDPDAGKRPMGRIEPVELPDPNAASELREKIKALSSEATASAFIIGCLPPGVITLISLASPSYMASMFQDPRGHVMLAGSAIWMGLGIFVMRRMINFKY